MNRFIFLPNGYHGSFKRQAGFIRQVNPVLYPTNKELSIGLDTVLPLLMPLADCSDNRLDEEMGAWKDNNRNPTFQLEIQLVPLPALGISPSTAEFSMHFFSTDQRTVHFLQMKVLVL